VGFFPRCICWFNIASSGSVTGKTMKLESKMSHHIQREILHTLSGGYRITVWRWSMIFHGHVSGLEKHNDFPLSFLGKLCGSKVRGKQCYSHFRVHETQSKVAHSHTSHQNQGLSPNHQSRGVTQQASLHCPFTETISLASFISAKCIRRRIIKS